MGKIPLLKTKGSGRLEPYNSSQQLVSYPAPTQDYDLANKAYVDAQIGANDTLQEITDNGAVTTNTITAPGLLSSASLGTAGTNVTAVHYGDGKNIVTNLTLTNVSYTIAGAADEAIGAFIYSFPSGTVSLFEVMSFNLSLQGGGTVDADTPDVGVGSVIATGAVAVLSGTATFEDYVTGQTAADCSGTSVRAFTAATAGYGAGISLNSPPTSKNVYLNIADGWAGADTVLISGSAVIKWTLMS